MAKSRHEQIETLIQDARHILITFGRDTKGDAIASAAALALFLRHKGKQVDVVSDGFVLPKKFSFLEGTDHILPKVPHLQKFMITIDVMDAGVEELNYDIRDKQLHIFITPESGFLTREHIQTAQSAFRHDLIIVLDTPDLSSLGTVYTKNTELFFTVPVINIDHHANNDHFGHVPLIDITASSTAELLTDLLLHIDAPSVNISMSTALLTGMIAKTQSFKSNNIRPHTLSTASKLVDMGADREAIIKRLYQTKSLAMLRLWGQALAHMNYDKSIGLVKSTITREDFIRSGASEHELYDIIDELIVNSPEEKMILLLHEHHDNGDGKDIHGVLHAEKGLNALALLADIPNKQGDEKRVSFILENMSLIDAENHVTALLNTNIHA